MVCQFGRGWHTNFSVLCTPNFLECVAILLYYVAIICMYYINCTCKASLTFYSAQEVAHNYNN